MITAEEARKMLDQAPVSIGEIQDRIVACSQDGIRVCGSGDFRHRPLKEADVKLLVDAGFKVEIGEKGWSVRW